MTTKAPEALTTLYKGMENIYVSAVFSGIVGDEAHRRRGGYHISIEDQASDNYSVTRPDDKAPPGDWPRNLASALDVSMSTADMALFSNRVRAVWADKSDTRRKYINAINGYLGSGNAQRWDFYAAKVSTATSDHKWHAHGELRRKFANSMTAVKAFLSMARGESHSKYLESIGKPPKPKPPAKVWARNLRYKPSPDMMYGDDVKRVQDRLKRNYRSYAGHLKVDGWYGKATELAVKEFQRRAGLKVTGVVDAVTAHRLGLI